MTTRKELETIKKKVLTALNSVSVEGHKIGIKTMKDTDILFLVSDVRIIVETFFLDITDKDFIIHLLISYEDIIEISDRNTYEILYEKVD